MYRTSVLLMALLLVPMTASADAASDLRQLFADEWTNRISEDPLFATSIGEFEFNDRLPSVAIADQMRLGAADREFLTRLQSIEVDSLSAADRISHELFARMLRDRIAEFEFKQYLMPITNRDGFHVSFPQLPEWIPLHTVKDYEDYIARLEAFKDYTAQHIELMSEGIKTGYVLPRIVLDGYENSITPHIVTDVTESLLYEPFREFPEPIPETERARLEEMGRNAIATSVVPAYRSLARFLKEDYVPAARKSIGASHLPNGKAFYEYRVRRFTTLEVTPEEIHERGNAEVQRIREEMQEILESVEFNGSFAEFVKFLRTDDRFYVDTPEQLMKEASYVLKKMDGELPGLFGTLPRTPYGIKRIPDFIAPKTTTAYYSRPSGDGTRAGFYYVNCYDLRSRPLYEIEALSLHEAVPGHHLQIARAQELEDLPMFRRFGGATAFVEGWALYAERLGLEVGFYEDPYSNFGRLTYEMWRALRLVVDTGIHYMDWSRQRAIDFMVENSALTVHNITTEVDRYISWPGQALAYKTGELKIRELRHTAEQALGEDFDVRAFHDVVLGSGAVPLDVLEANVVAWIEAQGRTPGE